MKKNLMIGLIVALLLIIVGGAGVAYAQFRGLDRNEIAAVTTFRSGDEVISQFGVGRGGMMGGSGNRNGMGGMMGSQGSGYGPGSMQGPFGSGMNGTGLRGTIGGMMGGRGFAEGVGPLHDYMISAFADAVGLSVEDVQTRLANGETFAQIAVSQGKAEADLPALWTQVRQAALDKAVADGVITQVQADLMKERMSNYPNSGFGPGYGEGCPMFDEQQLP